MSTVVVVKYPTDDRYVTLDFSDVIASSEAITAASITSVSPTGLTVDIDSFLTPTVTLHVGAGVDSLTYGVDVTITTSLPRTVTRTVAVVINSMMAYDYRNKNPEAFNTLLGSIEVGASAIGVGSFLFPANFDPTGGYVTWELVDNEGNIYANGNAYDYIVTSSGVSNRVEAHAVINAPSTLPVNLIGQKYQIRWRLSLNGTDTFSFEQLDIGSSEVTPLGVQDAVELAGDNCQLQIVLAQPYEKVGFEIYWQNTKVLDFVEVLDKSRCADGWVYRGIIATEVAYLPANLVPYTVVWSYWNTSTQTIHQRESGRLYVVNATILSCMNDMRVLINKSRTSIVGTPDILFTDPLLLAYLRRGRDAFNSAYGMLTAFDMTNAQGGIREFWLRCSEIVALRAQFLAEGEKVFNFSGQAISLDVDRTQYYSQLADNLQSFLDQELKPFKQNLIKKGIIAGDGDLTAIGPRPGSIGAVGITISPASNFGPFFGRTGNRGNFGGGTI